ncbi:primosomal protein N' [Candidatus Poribacteria bacterium]|nr:primosomal protein N' [Candidatus Poribacteria bacterium]
MPSPLYADVVFPIPVDQAFTYSVPSSADPAPSEGSRVLARFGARTLEGVVVAVRETPPELNRLLPITDVLDDSPTFPADILRLCRWVADYYLCSWGEALLAATPAGMRATARRRVSLTGAGRAADIAGMAQRAPVRAAILDALTRRDRRTVTHLRSVVGRSGTLAALNSLRLDQLVTFEDELEPGIGPKRVLVARLAQTPSETAELLDTLRTRAPRQAEALQHLVRSDGEAPVSELTRARGVTYQTMRSLERKGFAIIDEIEESRFELPDSSSPFGVAAEPHVLNADQAYAVGQIIDALDRRSPTAFVLRGVTGSGKTEVYLRAVQRALELGRDSIVLVPEISLTPQTVDRLSARFGARVAVLHSRLSAGERYDAWVRIRRGDAPIVVGARSAVFAPVPRLGLVIVDEEHEGSYKQEDPAPRYHARDVALRRAFDADAPLVLGSATPSQETMHHIRTGEFEHIEMPSRVSEADMPMIHVVDMRAELRAGNRSIFSKPLADAMTDRLSRGEQVMLFLNRRGFSTYVFCRSCGHVERCPDCDLSYTYHERTDLLMCHACGRVAPMPRVCPAPNCGDSRIRQLGLGTQRVEAEAAPLMPNARIARMDADTTTGKDAHERILAAFYRHEIDVLIGTQMIAKGLDVPGVTLVGVLLAETSLNLPDFRAGERTMNLLTQVAGRSGRGTRAGEVIFQTYQPEHYAIAAAANHDFIGFTEQEYRKRAEHHYPPELHATRLLFRGEDRKRVELAAKRAAEVIAEAIKERQKEAETDDVLLKGPAPAPIARIGGEYRWHCLLCALDSSRIRDLIAPLVQPSTRRKTRGVSVTVDVDPGSVL